MIILITTEEAVRAMHGILLLEVTHRAHIFRDGVNVSLDQFPSSINLNFAHPTLNARKTLFPYVWILNKNCPPET